MGKEAGNLVQSAPGGHMGLGTYSAVDWLHRSAAYSAAGPFVSRRG
jgi:hypothetical protein